MNATTKLSPPTLSPSETGALGRAVPDAAPRERVVPEVEPLRDLPEVIESIVFDARVAPGEYLDEVRVVFGGE